MKIILFARTLGSTRLCKILQESSLLSNFGNMPKIGNARFGHCGPLGIKADLYSVVATDTKILLRDSPN